MSNHSPAAVEVFLREQFRTLMSFSLPNELEFASHETVEATGAGRQPAEGMGATAVD